MTRPLNRTTAQPVAVALCFSLLAACSDGGELQSPALLAPEHVVVDLTGGHFSFMTPLGSGEKDGVFNPRLSPVVEICRLATSGQPTATTPCAATVAWFSEFSGSGPERVTVDARREMYGIVVNLSRYTLPAAVYRIFVGTGRVGTGTAFGFTNIAIAPSSKEARALAGPGVATATATSDLPIKFRIEEGALCGISDDCFEGAVGAAGGTFVTNTEFAGVQFPAGALSDTRTLVVTRIYEGDTAYCLPTTEPQYEGCYHYRLEPALLPGETFDLEVTVGICLDPAAVPFEDQMELQKWDETSPASLRALPRREVEFLECEGFSLAAIDAGGTFATLASAGGRAIGALAQVFLPTPLAASTKSPYGGGLNDFSRIGWVRPLSLTPVQGGAQSACAGTTVPIAPTVVVTSTITGDPVSGATVKWALAAPGGSLSPVQSISDALGLASTSWTLGGSSGSQAMLAVGRGSTEFPNYTLIAPNWASTVFRAEAQSCTN